jgi:hypothetical protein
MKRILALAVLGTALVVGAQPALADNIETSRYASNTTWHVFTGVPPAGPLGHAQTVCLNAAAPVNCPPGATLYGHPGGGWSASLSSIPHALWIWAPGIDGTSHPAELAQYFFTKRIRIHGHPVSGRIWVAADDFAAVRVNGTTVGHVGSTTDASIASVAQSTLTAFAIGPYLHRGRNRITVRAQNGEGSFAGCTDCTYQLQPAGVVFGVKIRFEEDDDDD